MIDMFTFIVFALATFAMSSLLVEFDGPAGIFAWLRDKFPKSPLNCIVCTATWVSFLFFMIVLLGYGNYLTPLAGIGIGILLERL